jgi:hypothetical protein
LQDATIGERRTRDLLDEDRISERPWLELPPAERVADRLADLLFGTDEILGFLQEERATALRWMEPEIHRLYKDLDALMGKVTD